MSKVVFEVVEPRKRFMVQAFTGGKWVDRLDFDSLEEAKADAMARADASTGKSFRVVDLFGCPYQNVPDE